MGMYGLASKQTFLRLCRHWYTFSCVPCCNALQVKVCTCAAGCDHNQVQATYGSLRFASYTLVQLQSFVCCLQSLQKQQTDGTI